MDVPKLQLLQQSQAKINCASSTFTLQSTTHNVQVASLLSNLAVLLVYQLLNSRLVFIQWFTFVYIDIC